MSTVVELLLTVLAMGGVPVMIRHVSANVWTIGLVRLGVAVVAIGAWVVLAGRWQRPTPREWRALASIGLIFGVHWALYFLSIKVASASIAAIGFATFGVHLIVLGWVIGHHAVTRLDLAAVGLAVAGSLFVVPEWRLASGATTGLALAMVSALLYAFLPILHQRHARLPTGVRTLGQFAFALPVFLVFAPLARWDLPASDWGWLAVLATVGTVLAHTLWTRLSTRLSTLTTSVVFYLNLPVSLALAAVFLGERLTVRMAAGAALIVAGNLLGVRARAAERSGFEEGAERLPAPD